MRVLFISNLYPPHFIGGYELACSEVVHGLINRGHEALVLTSFSHVPAPPEPEYINRCLDLRCSYLLETDAKFIEYNRFEACCSNLQNTYEVSKAVRRFKPDIVYCWNLYGIGGLAIIDLLTMVGVPWVLCLEDNVPGVLLNQTEPRIRTFFLRENYDILRDARIIAVSVHLLSEVYDTTGITFRRGAEVIPYWVASRGMPVRSTYQCEGRTRFVMSGIILAHKGVDLILQAAAHLLHQGFVNFDIDFYGKGSIDYYRSMAISLGLHNHVRFLGERKKSHLLEQYQHYDVFLFPTWEREPCGHAPIEAAACGCVPIITSTCGVAEWFVDGVHCLKTERTVEALVETMRAIVCRQVDLSRLGQATIALARSDLIIDRCLDHTEKILENERRNWDQSVLNDVKLPLLIHTKHHFARSLVP